MQRATNLSRKMVTSFGMSETLGPRTFGQQESASHSSEIGERDYSEKTALIIDSEVNKLIDEAHRTASKILTKNKKILVHLADTLIAVETLEGEALETVFSGGTPPQPIRGTVTSVSPQTSRPINLPLPAPQIKPELGLLPD